MPEMALELMDLDPRTRELMIAELERDLAAGSLYLSPRLSEHGRTRYPGLLRDAFGSGDDGTLAQSLGSEGLLNATETARKPKGGVTTKRVPVTAPQTMGEGEFNRFYLRALCLRALEAGHSNVTIYRARASSAPRPESEAMVGTSIDAAALLEDLRTHPGVDTALGLPPGPNSGLSGRLPQD
jgi:hypothetical protein